MNQGNDPAQDDPAAGSSSKEPSEVELDSLGHLFIELADKPPSQDESESQQVSNVQVIAISSSFLETFVA